MTHLISVAPMMDWTDRHDRYFLRLIAPDVRLYTEMVTAQALKYGDIKRLLAFDEAEHPIALQLGGSDPVLLVEGAQLGEAAGYDEINLNVGCPSDRVQKGRFGACLMLEPELVAECVAAMRAKVNIPVTVKCRVGVDEQDSYEALQRFVNIVSSAGCQTFIVHARKAWLSGLSPKENREIPPLQYNVVRQIKQDFPGLTIILNGGIKTLAEIDEHLQFVDGVMIGREAYNNPYFLASVQKKYFPQQEILTRHEVLRKLLPYIEEQLKKNIKLTAITRHILGLFLGRAGAANWRRYISEHAHHKEAGIEVLERALHCIK